MEPNNWSDDCVKVWGCLYAMEMSFVPSESWISFQVNPALLSYYQLHTSPAHFHVCGFCSRSKKGHEFLSTYLTLIYWFIVSVCLSSYGCMLEVSNKAWKKSLHATPASWVLNKIPSASIITWSMHR